MCREQLTVRLEVPESLAAPHNFADSTSADPAPGSRLSEGYHDLAAGVAGGDALEAFTRLVEGQLSC